jgi:hypothetical protein
MKKSFFILLIFSLFALFPLVTKGFFVTDDADWMIIRFSAFHQTLRDGEIPVRFLGRLNQEYGYPVSTFLYPGFMYLAEPFKLIGFGFVASIKIILGLSLLASSIFCYFWLKKFFDQFSSLIGAAFYLYLPYHLYDVYTRGSVGEVLALAILPFILWQIERKSMILASIGIGLLLLSHNILAALFLGFLLCYFGLDIFLAKKRKQSILRYACMLGLGGGLSAFFWIPALFELPYTVFSKTTISQWREYFASFPLIGFSVVIVLLFTLFHMATKKIMLKKHRLTVLFFVVGILSLFFATAMSSFLWEILPVQFIQFPFRFLSLLLICVAFLVTVNISLLQGKRQIVIGIGLIAVLAFSAYPFFQSIKYTQKDEGYYSTNMDTTTVHDEYMPLWVKTKPTVRAEKKVEISKGEGITSSVVYNNKQIQFAIESKKVTTVQINTIYWNGWKAFLDNKEIPIQYQNPKGVMRISVPNGKHEVIVLFSETPVRLLSDILSCISLCILLGISAKRFYKS